LTIYKDVDIYVSNIRLQHKLQVLDGYHSLDVVHVPGVVEAGVDAFIT
jgi:hypothetical protein